MLGLTGQELGLCVAVGYLVTVGALAGAVMLDIAVSWFTGRLA